MTNPVHPVATASGLHVKKNLNMAVFLSLSSLFDWFENQNVKPIKHSNGKHPKNLIRIIKAAR